MNNFTNRIEPLNVPETHIDYLPRKKYDNYFNRRIRNESFLTGNNLSELTQDIYTGIEYMWHNESFNTLSIGEMQTIVGTVAKKFSSTYKKIDPNNSNTNLTKVTDKLRELTKKKIEYKTNSQKKDILEKDI